MAPGQLFRDPKNSARHFVTSLTHGARKSNWSGWEKSELEVDEFYLNLLGLAARCCMERTPLSPIQVMPLTSDFDILLSADESIGAGDKVDGMSSREF